MKVKVDGLALFLLLGLSAQFSNVDAANYTLSTVSQAQAGRSLQSILTVYYSSPQNVQVLITKKDSETILLSESKATPGDGMPSDIVMDIPIDWETGEYMLNISNDVFKGSVEFDVVALPYAILIQTDKPIYKPSQTVNIRVAIIDDNLLPKNETVDVVVEDAEGNKIQQWRNQQAQMGLLQFKLPLSDRPPLGDWLITVTAQDTVKENTIKIDEYVLPRFEVTVEMPSYILKKATSLMCTVRAQYTYGEDVSGDLSITFHSTKNLTKDGIKINGVAMVELDLDDIQTIGLAYGAVSAEAFVYEPLSGKTLSGTSSTEIAVSDYVVTFHDFNSKTYRPGQDFIAYFGVTRPDGQLIKGESNTLEVTVNYNSHNEQIPPVNVTAAVPDSGTVTVTLPMPSDAYYISIDTELVLENGERITGVSVYDLDEFQTLNPDIFLKMSSDIAGIPMVGDTAAVSVTSSMREGMFNYMVTSGGRIVTHGTGTLTSGAGSFSLPIIQGFTPQAFLVVSAVVEGEWLADSVSFNVDGAFQNQVTLEFTDTDNAPVEEVRPGTSINVRVNTDAGSTVGLLSVDKSVLLLAGGNDITQTQIITELMNLVKTESVCEDEYSSPSPILFCWFPTFGGSSSEDVFALAGVTITTDAALKECHPGYWIDDSVVVFAALPEGARGGAGPNLDADVETSQSPIVKTRQFFPETWLWDLVLSPAVYDSPDDSPNVAPPVPDNGPVSTPAKRTVFPETWLWSLAVSVELTRRRAKHLNTLKEAPKTMYFMVRASAAGQSPPSYDSAPAQRTFFPETWLWDLLVSEDGTLVIPETVPDTITTWVTTALSMNPTTGISVTAQSTELTVKLPFFISPVLPYSAVKGEELQLKILVNNYGEADDLCTVTIMGSDQYEVKESENHLYMPGEDLTLSPLSIAKGSSAVVVTWLKPMAIDTIQLSASATCTSGASDAFQRELLVKAPGFPQESCQSKFIQLEAGDADVTNIFNIVIVGDYVEESMSVQIQVTGDVMGPSIEGLDSLVRMPYGCGEQNMISFAPNIFVRAYLKHTGDIDLDIVERTNTYMMAGYQRELTYKHSDGSFSAFTSDPSGSTWLTAFVMKCFRQSNEHIEIDLSVLEKSLMWLNQQKSSETAGMFNEPGRVIHSDMQGGASGGITLTAFVVIAMLEDVTGSELTSRISSLSSTISYLEGSFSVVQDNAYQLSIITYALQLSQSAQVDSFLAKLETLQKSEGGLVWWDKPSDSAQDSQDAYYRGGPSSVEMTSYALLTYIERNEISKAKPIAMWLTESRGSSGGYFSTQDTVLGLQSLAAYAKLVISDSTDLQVDFETDRGHYYNHTITAANAIITKKHFFKPAEGITTVTAKISGQGSSIVTACTGYNVMTVPQKPTTSVNATVTKPSEGSENANLKACITYIGEGDSGMGLTQVMLPTGYSAAVEDAILESGDLAYVESVANGLAVYWNAISSVESCVNIELVQDSVVKDIKDSYITGTQYYNTESGSRSFYNPVNAPIVMEPKPYGAASAVNSMIALTITALAVHFF